MRFLIPTMMCFFLGTSAYSQEHGNEKFDKIFKINLITEINKDAYAIGNLAPDLIFLNKSGNMHEVELNKISVTKGNSFGGKDGKLKESFLGLRYQFNFFS